MHIFEKIIIQQKRSSIGFSRNQKNTLKLLGLNKINSIVIHKKTPQILGMIKKINHLVVIKDNTYEN